MSQTAVDQFFFLRKLWALEHGVFVCNMLQFIVGCKETVTHSLPELFQFLPADQPSRVAVIPLYIRHNGDCILFVPGCPGVDEPSATVADVLELHVLYLCPLPLSPADTVLQIDNIICDHNVRMFTSN